MRLGSVLCAALALTLLVGSVSAFATGFPGNTSCPATISNSCPSFYMVPYADYRAGSSPLSLTPAEQAVMRSLLNTYLAEFLAAMPPSLAATNPDPSVWTGAAGYALGLLRLAISNQSNRTRAELLALATTYSDIAVNTVLASSNGTVVSGLPGESTGFLLSPPGVFAVAAVVAQATGNATAAQIYSSWVSNFAEMVTFGPNASTPGYWPDTYAEGRAGLLYACMFLEASGVPGCNKLQIAELGESLFESGVAAGNATLALQWPWCVTCTNASQCQIPGTQCLGTDIDTAHGSLGPVIQLLAPGSYFPVPETIMETALDSIVGFQLPSGNYPSGPFFTEMFGLPNNDTLVQWCFGAPGFVQAMIFAHRRFGKPVYLEAARNAAQVIWARGALTKGLSLCHGTSGNTYALLSLYNYTQDDRYLYYATAMQRFVISSPLQSEPGLMRLQTPDPLATSSYWAGSWWGAITLWSDLLASGGKQAMMTGFVGGLDLSVF